MTTPIIDDLHKVHDSDHEHDYDHISEKDVEDSLAHEGRSFARTNTNSDKYDEAIETNEVMIDTQRMVSISLNVDVDNEIVTPFDKETVTTVDRTEIVEMVQIKKEDVTEQLPSNNVVITIFDTDTETKKKPNYKEIICSQCMIFFKQCTYGIWHTMVDFFVGCKKRFNSLMTRFSNYWANRNKGE